MKILFVHNRNKLSGGEEYICRAEGEILSKNGHIVDYLIFDNNTIRNGKDRFSALLGLIFNYGGVRKLASKIMHFKPDVIHVHDFMPMASPAIFRVAKKYHVPVVHTLHNYRLLCPGATLFYKNRLYEKSVGHIFPWEAMWKRLYQNSFWQTAAVAIATALHHFKGTWARKVDRYIVPTIFARHKFEASVLHIPRDKFVIKPHFVNDMGKGSRNRENFFLYAGSLSVEKGIHCLLMAAQQDGFNLIVMGDGPLRGVVEGASRLYPNICYMGYRPKGEVWYYMKKCKAVIFPSLWYETFGMTIIEAFSTATPVIASRRGAMNELVQEGVNGLLYEPGDAYELCYAIRKLNGDVALAGELSFNARITYLRRYTPRVNYKKLIKIYEDVIRDKQPSVVKEPEYHPTLSE